MGSSKEALLTSSTRLKAGDSAAARTAPSFAVHRPGSPSLPAQHGMPCRGFVPSRICACLAIADTFDYTTI
jgi:hypothetical protein